MKKIIVLLLTVILCALVFVSCGTPKTTEALMAKIDKKMDSLDSYEADMTANFSTNLSGYRCTADFTGKNIVSGVKSGKYYYYDSMDGVTEIKDTEKNETVESVTSKSVNAFHDGNMFVQNEQGDIQQRLYSPLAAEEYIAYREKQSGAFDIDFESCVNKTFARNEDKSWTLNYSGYTKKTIDEIVEQFGMEDLFEEEVEDMEITIHANSDYTAKEMDIRFVFANGSTNSDFRMNAKYDKYNEAIPIVDTLDTSSYWKVADCRLLTDIEDMLEDLEEKENGSFILALSQKLSTSFPSYTQTTEERDVVTYGKKDGKYYYNVKATYDSGVVQISYENGKQTVKMSGSTETVDQTEEEAKAFISGLINTASYESVRVTGIEKTTDSIYKIYCKAADNLYKPVFSSLGSPRNVSQVITITVKDGKITEIENSVFASATTMAYGTVEFTLTSTNDFS